MNSRTWGNPRFIPVSSPILQANFFMLRINGKEHVFLIFFAYACNSLSRDL
jgi:hypothetical protein